MFKSQNRWLKFNVRNKMSKKKSVLAKLLLLQSSLLHKLHCQLPATTLELITTIVLAIASTSAEVVFRFDVNVLQIMTRDIIEVQLNFLTSHSDRNLFFAT